MGALGLTVLTDPCCFEVARRDTLIVPIAALNTSVLSPESQQKTPVLISVMCSWTSEDSAGRHLVRSTKGPAVCLQLASVGARNWILHILSHLKDLMSYKGRFSAEVEEVGVSSASIRHWAYLPFLLAIRKYWVPNSEHMRKWNGTYLQLLGGKFEAVKTSYRGWSEKSCQEQKFSLTAWFSAEYWGGG